MPKDKGKKKTKEVREKVLLQSSLVWDKLTPRERKMVCSFAEGYKHFLNAAKTEREAVAEIERYAIEHGFTGVGDPAARDRLYKVY